MLSALNRGLPFRLAMALAAFAALCFIAPPAAMAFGHGKAAVHCLTHADDLDHGLAPDSQHGAKHHGDHSAPSGQHQSNCCGLFCLSALPVDGSESIEAPWGEISLAVAPEPSFLGQTPVCPDRPPIVSLAV
jgi:hypothetical protein